MTLATAPALGVDVAAWFGIQVSSGYLVHRLPDTFLEVDGWLFRERGWERGGRLYIRAFRVRRWKPMLPEAGGVFPGGFDKRNLAGRDPAYLNAYVRETRRGELGHLLAMLPVPLFFVWNAWPLDWSMALYALAVNGPCIVAQRFNRIRLRRVLAAARTGRGRPPPLEP